MHDVQSRLEQVTINDDSAKYENGGEPLKASTPAVKRKTGTGQQPGVNVNFEAEILPVTCKENMGLLIKRKLERGATRKCIRIEDGNWFTPGEFEIRGGHEKAKNWRNNLTCGGKTLRLLMEHGFIHPPLTTKKVIITLYKFSLHN
ncbi:nuclear body protein SP140-like protein [Phyllostomus discolor]|uniref:Nuclear body protein SP140-like protein n=1 Tax=Phyllostomus discolor TaxID=89673 RepID=A0A7E6DPQ0_9CHIR|nr:nuclear body protein SP140-like protein [Phyllostomus discolor]